MKKQFNSISQNIIRSVSIILFIYSFLVIYKIAIHPIHVLNNIHQTYRLFIALILIITSVRLYGRRHGAWIMAVSLVSFLTISYARQTLRGHDYDAPYIFISVIVLIALLVSRKNYQIKRSQASILQSLIGGALTIIGALSYGTIGFLYFDQSVFQKNFSVLESLIQTIKEMTSTNTDLIVTRKSGEAFIDSLPFVGIFVITAVVWLLYRPIRFRLEHSTSDFEQAKNIYKRYSNDTEDWFKFFPNNFHYFIVQDAFIAYRISNGVAIALGDPVGKKSDVIKCVEEWCDYIKSQGWSPSAVHINNNSALLYKNAGLEILTIGGEAIIDTKEFNSNTIKTKHFRNITNRMTKKGYKFEILTNPINPTTLESVKSISDEWLNKDNHKERQFGLGFYDNAYIGGSDLAIIKDLDGEIVAFANLIPNIVNQTASVDLMRYKPLIDSGLMYYLLSELILSLHNSGLVKFNLGFVPLAKENLVDKERFKENMLLNLRLLGNRFFAFSGLEQFKNKFDPEWEDRNLAYSSNKLPKTLYALEKLMRIN